MSYAQDRVCWDADSHLMPEKDFLSKHAEAGLRETLVINGGANGGAGFEKWFNKILDDVHDRLKDPEKTAALEHNVIASAKGWAAHGAVDGRERSRTMDLLGFKGQLVFSTFAGSFVRNLDPKVMYGGTRAHNRAMAEFCGDDSRLMAVGFIPQNDPKLALEALHEALELGCRAIHVPSDAPGGNQKGFSPAHADLDPFWDVLAEAGVPVVLHIGGGKLLPKAYHNNGREAVTDWLGGGENLRGKDFHTLCHSPQNFLGSMILDGIFDRFPKLQCGAIELGATWLPGFSRTLDYSVDNFKRNEPILKNLSMKPSEFIAKHLKVTPFPFEDIGWLIEQCGNESLLFSTDYPHPEGGRDPIKRFEASMDATDTPETSRKRFYEDNFKQLLGISG